MCFLVKFAQLQYTHTYLKINHLDATVSCWQTWLRMQVLKDALTMQFTRPTKSDYPKAGPGEGVFLKSDQLVPIHQVGDLQIQGHLLAFILWCSLDLNGHQTTGRMDRRARRLYELKQPSPSTSVWLPRNPTVPLRVLTSILLSTINADSEGLWV